MLPAGEFRLHRSPKHTCAFQAAAPTPGMLIRAECKVSQEQQADCKLLKHRLLQQATLHFLSPFIILLSTTAPHCISLRTSQQQDSASKEISAFYFQPRSVKHRQSNQLRMFPSLNNVMMTYQPIHTNLNMNKHFDKDQINLCIKKQTFHFAE